MCAAIREAILASGGYGNVLLIGFVCREQLEGTIINCLWCIIGFFNESLVGVVLVNNIDKVVA